MIFAAGKQISSLQERIKELEIERNQLSNQVVQAQAALSKLEDENRLLYRQVHELETKCAEQKKNCSELLVDLDKEKNNVMNTQQEHETMEYKSEFSKLARDLCAKYSQLISTENKLHIEDCFWAEFGKSWEAKMSEISLLFNSLVDFLQAASLLAKLEGIIEQINKYYIAFSTQELFRRLDATFMLPEADKYQEAKTEEINIKRKLVQLGVSIEWINQHYNPDKTKRERNIPHIKENETYSQYLRRVLNCFYGDFDGMMNAYKKITPREQRRLYDNIKLLTAALKANGVTRTPNQLYDYLEKE